MFKIFTIVLLLLLNLSSAKGLTQPQPLVLTNKSYNYIQDNFDSTNNSIEFNEFTTGKKYYKRYTEDWDDQCQDAVMYHVYGKNWRKFKRVAVEFVRAVQKGDSEAIANLCTTPMIFSVSNKIHYDGTIGHGIWDAEDKDKIIQELNHEHGAIIQPALQDAQYKNFVVQEWGNSFVDRDICLIIQYI